MSSAREMPQYQSHKKVWALKIKQVELRPADGHIIHPADEGYGPFEVSDEYVQKHNPQAGGYYVVYADGYISWSPAEAFEGGHTAIEMRNRGADQSTEAAIVAAGATKAPRVTPADVADEIVSETYTVLPSGRVTVCELTLKNGFTVRGESAVVFIENFDVEIGRRVAKENATREVWQLLGYALRSKLAAGA